MNELTTRLLDLAIAIQQIPAPTFHEAQQIQEHLKAQDDALNALLDKVAKLEAAHGGA